MSGVAGIFGIDRSLRAADLAYLALYALQHRGQEAAGMAVSDGHTIRMKKGMGLMADVFAAPAGDALPGPHAIGYVGYRAPSGLGNVGVPPFLGHTARGPLAIAHSGELTNARTLREQLQRRGAVFHTETNAEIILHLLAGGGDGDLVDVLGRAAGKLQGGFAAIVLGQDIMIGFRDAAGIRPLSWGWGDGFVALASESAALASLGVVDPKNVPPGHMVVVTPEGVRTEPFVAERPRPAPCAFEHIYFARPDSDLDGRNVHQARKAIGRMLWEEKPVDADIVIPAPDSGVSAAMGFAEASGLPFEMGLIKNRYIGRTFIQPSGAARELGVRIKLNPIRPVLAGKRVVVIDDSIVRGTTSRKMIQLLRDAGAAEVHLYVASPPFKHPCHYGMHIQSPHELIAATRSVEEIRRYVGADTLYYLSREGLAKAVGLPADELCMGCMTGEYPPGTLPHDAGESGSARDVSAGRGDEG